MNVEVGIEVGLGMVLELTDARAAAAAVAGGKGAALARLAARGLPVPEGAVITTEAFAAFGETFDLPSKVASLLADDDGGDSFDGRLASLREEIHRAEIPDGVTIALRAYVTRMEQAHGAKQLWAVRSSAVAEDGDRASFAGQHDTVLGVCGYDQIVGALRTCWASFLNPHAVRYRQVRKMCDFRGAVVVQRLVDAESAGVAFTADPLRGDGNRIVINSNFGLGESVVGGQVTPDMFVVDKASLAVIECAIADKSHEVVAAPGGCAPRPLDTRRRQVPSLTDNQIRAVAELGRTIEQQEQRPVDYEWAVRGDREYLLQSRPITSRGADEPDAQDAPAPGWHPELDTPIDPEFPLYSNGNISEVLPGCITPLSWSYVGAAIDHSFRAQARALGVSDDPRHEFRSLGYFFFRPYLCVSFLSELPRRIPGVSPDVLYEELIGPPPQRTPSFSWRDLDPRRLLRLAAVMIDVRRQLGRAADLEAAVHAERRGTTAACLRTWSDDALLASVRPCAANSEASVVHVWASSFAVSLFGVLRALCARWLGDSEGVLAARLVTGIGGMPSADPAFALEKLGDLVRASPQLTAAFANEADDRCLLAELRDSQDSAGHSFCRELDVFLDRFGHRAVCEAEFRNPCWREKPTQVIAMLRNVLAPGATRPSDLRVRQREVRERATREARGRLSAPRRLILTFVLERTRHSLAQREQLKDLIVLGSDRARRIYTELRRRLVERDQLADDDSIFFLLGSEVEALARKSMSAATAAERVARRRAEYRICQGLGLPKIQRGTPRWLEAAEPESDGGLRGLGVSPGSAEGIARVVLDPRTDGHMVPGEILVCPVTDAGWTPLFVSAAALVVEVGGLLSHGSVVAREYGLPAVVGVAGATRHIRSGDRLRVDANSGRVVVLPPSP